MTSVSPQKGMWATEAHELFETLRPMLEPYCRVVEVAGSLRRQRRAVKDLEIVVIPKQAEPAGQADLFGAVHALPLQDPLTAFLWRECEDRDSEWSYRLASNGRKAFGPENKLLTYGRYRVDVFSTSPTRFGMCMFVRTGDADWNKAVFAHLKRMAMNGHPYGGILLNQARQITTPLEAHLVPHNVAPPAELLCPQERDVFNALGWPEVPPEERTGVKASQLAIEGSANW